MAALAFPASPTNGQVYSANGNTWKYDSTSGSWLSANSVPYDIASGIPGKPTASEVVGKFDIARALLFANNFGGSAWTCGTAPTSAAVFNVDVNGTSVGTINFAASATTATFTTVSTGAVSVSAGSVLTIVAPATADSTLSDASGTLAGTLQ